MKGRQLRVCVWDSARAAPPRATPCSIIAIVVRAPLLVTRLLYVRAARGTVCGVEGGGRGGAWRWAGGVGCVIRPRASFSHTKELSKAQRRSRENRSSLRRWQRPTERYVLHLHPASGPPSNANPQIVPLPLFAFFVHALLAAAIVISCFCQGL